MMEEWKARGELLKELDNLRNRIAQLELVEQKGMGGELEEFKRGFRRIFNNVVEGVLFADLENERFITGNRAICQILGYNIEDITNLEMTSVYPPEDPYHLIEQFEKQVDGEFVFRKDIPVKRKDGSNIYVDLFSIPLIFTRKTYLLCFLREISSREVGSILSESTSDGSYTSQLLTETEIKIIRLIVKGMSSTEIAHLFHRSKRTIENHRAHIMKKLGVDTSVELVRRAIAMGLVDLSGK